jgi:hypothetical protein
LVVVGAVDGKDIGWKASALNIPVLGAGAPLIAVTPVELTVVLVKFAVPLPPVPPFNAPTRFNTWPFGERRFITTSPTQVCVIVKVTLILETMAPPGIPETATLLDVPAGLLSGIFNGNPAEALNTTVAGDDALVSVNCWILPVHIVADVGFTVAISGVTVNVPTPEKSTAVQGPCITARYW